MSYYHAGGHPDCLIVAAVQTLQGRNKNSTHGAKLKQSSIHGAELKQNSIHGAELKQNSIHGAELKQNSIHGAELKQRRWEKEMMKNEFYALYLTRKKPDVERWIFAYYMKKKTKSSLNK